MKLKSPILQHITVTFGWDRSAYSQANIPRRSSSLGPKTLQYHIHPGTIQLHPSLYTTLHSLPSRFQFPPLLFLSIPSTFLIKHIYSVDCTASPLQAKDRATSAPPTASSCSGFMPTYLRLQRHNDQNTQVRMPKTSPNTRDNPSPTAPKASSVFPRTEPRDKTLGPTEYPSATVLIKELWIVFRQDYTSGKAFERDRHATEENFIFMHLSL